MVDQYSESSHMAVELIPARGVSKERIAAAAQLISLADSTTEGRSIVALARRRYRTPALHNDEMSLENISSPQTGVSGIDSGGKSFRKGSCAAVRRYVERQGGRMPEAVKLICTLVRMYGGTPLVLAEGAEVLGVVHLCDAGAACINTEDSTRE